MFDNLLADLDDIMVSNVRKSVSRDRMKRRVVDDKIEVYVEKNSIEENEIGSVMEELSNIGLELQSKDGNIEYDSMIIGPVYKIMLFYKK